MGAFAVTSPPLKEYFVNTVRPFIFTTALPPAVLSWSRLTLRRMQGMGASGELAALGRRLRRNWRREAASPAAIRRSSR